MRGVKNLRRVIHALLVNSACGIPQRRMRFVQLPHWADWMDGFSRGITIGLLWIDVNVTGFGIAGMSKARPTFIQRQKEYSICDLTNFHCNHRCVGSVRGKKCISHSSPCIVAVLVQDAKDKATTGNWGILDIQSALRWVQREVAAFGGDKHRVAIHGQSSGGGLVELQYVAPGSKGLFRGAISESGGLDAGKLEQAYESTRAVAKAVRGCAVLEQHTHTDYTLAGGGGGHVSINTGCVFLCGV